MVLVPVTFPVIIVHKDSKQDDGDNLQNQGHDWELHPHVGGVCWHPETNSSYLSQSDPHEHTNTLTNSACLSLPICLFRGCAV